MKLTLGDIRRALNIKCESDTDNIVITEISKNSQTIKPGGLFVPLRGARFDGHDFIQNAVEAGASAVLCDRNDLCPSVPTLRVDNTLEAVQRLAGWYLSGLDVKKIGVTGSVGKTTTSIMIKNALSKKLKVFKTSDDMNGQIGMTFSAFELDPSYDVAVFEMGMSQYGELSRLTRIVQPDIAVINMIGSAHIEFFNTKENILKAKLEILEGLKPNGTVVLNGDDELLRGLKDKLSFKTVYYGLYNENADVKGEYICYKNNTENFTCDDHKFAVPSKGLHYVQNALAAIAVGRELGIDDESIASGLMGFESAKGRQKMYKANGYNIIEDCYNASPEAVKASLGVLKDSVEKQGIAVLGDMLELGDHAKQAHLECGECAAECCDILIAFGDNAKYYAEGAERAGMSSENIYYFTDRADVTSAVKRLAEIDDTILFKGSHGMKLDSVLLDFLGNNVQTGKA